MYTNRTDKSAKYERRGRIIEATPGGLAGDGRPHRLRSLLGEGTGTGALALAQAHFNA